MHESFAFTRSNSVRPIKLTTKELPEAVRARLRLACCTYLRRLFIVPLHSTYHVQPLVCRSFTMPSATLLPCLAARHCCSRSKKSSLPWSSTQSYESKCKAAHKDSSTCCCSFCNTATSSSRENCELVQNGTFGPLALLLFKRFLSVPPYRPYLRLIL